MRRASRVFRSRKRSEVVSSAKDWITSSSDATRQACSSQRDRGDEAGLGLAVEGPTAGGHLVEQCSEGEDVGARIGLDSFQMLRGHVLERAQNRPFLRERFLLRGAVGRDFDRTTFANPKSSSFAPDLAIITLPVSRALKTSPIPPAPIGATISYSPRRVPAVTGMRVWKRDDRTCARVSSPAAARDRRHSALAGRLNPEGVHWVCRHPGHAL